MNSRPAVMGCNPGRQLRDMDYGDNQRHFPCHLYRFRAGVDDPPFTQIHRRPLERLSPWAIVAGHSSLKGHPRGGGTRRKK